MRLLWRAPRFEHTTPEAFPTHPRVPMISSPSTCLFFFFFVSAFKSDIIFAIAYYSRFDLACYSLLIGFQWDTRLDYVEYRRRCNVHVRFLWFGIVHGRSVLFEIEIYVSLCTEAGLRAGLLMFNGED